MDSHLTWYKCWIEYLRLAISSMLQIKDSFSFFFSQNNFDIYLTYTTHTLNNFNTYSSITFSFIQEYLGNRSNNLYFLFSHSWPVVVYNFGQVQFTVRLRETQNVLKKTTAGDIAVIWTALFNLNIRMTIFGHGNNKNMSKISLL